MKLHLPKVLFTAVMATFAMVSTTWAYNGPTEDADGNPETPGTQTVSYNKTVEWGSDTNPPDVNTPKDNTLYTDVNSKVDIFAPTGEGSTKVHIQLSGTDGVQSCQNNGVELGTINAESLWISKGRFEVRSTTNLSNAGDIHVSTGMLHFYTGTDTTTELDNNITLGTSTAGSHWGSTYANIKNAAMLVGAWDSTNATVTIGGNLTIAENTKIALQYGNELNLNGDLIGSNDLEIAYYDGGDQSSSVTLGSDCDTSNFTGAITLTGSTAGTLTLKLGNAAVQTGGLSGACAVGLDTVTASALTLKVAQGRDLTYSGALAAGISVVKSGAGTQTLTGTMAGGVTVKEGRLNLYGTSANGITGLILESGATLGIDKALTGSDTLSISLNGKLAIKADTNWDATFTVAGGSFSSTSDGETAAGSGYATGMKYLVADGVTIGDAFSVDGYTYTAENGQVIVSKSNGEEIDTTTFYINENATWGAEGYTDNTATTYVVAAGKTFDVNWPNVNNAAAPLEEKNLLLKEGATLTNTGTSTGTSWKQFVNITLGGDAYVDSSKNIGLLAGGHGATTLTLDGHTLTKKGTSTFYMINTTVDAGTIDIQGGTVQVGCNSGELKQTDASSTIFSLSGGHLTVHSGDTLKLSSLTGSSASSANSRVNGDGTMHILGSGDAATSAMLEGALNVVVNKDSGTQTIGMGTDWTGNLTLTKGTLKLNMASGAALDNSRVSRTNGKLMLAGAGTYTITGADKNRADMGLEMDNGWAGKIVLVNSHIGGSNLNSYATQRSVLKLVGYSGWMDFYNGNINCDIELENYSVDGVTTTKSAFVFDDNSKGKEYKFNRKVFGSGDFQMATCAAATDSASISFTGDTSEWTGGIIITNAFETAHESKLNNTATMDINLTGGGDIFSADSNKGFVMDRASTNDGDNIINLNIGNTDAASTMNGAISMGDNAGDRAQLKLTVTGDTTFKKEVEVTSLTVDANKTATLEAATTTDGLTTNGTIKVTGNGSLTYGGTTTVTAPAQATFDTETTGATITAGSITGGVVTFTGDTAVTETRTISDSSIVNNGTAVAAVTVGAQNASVNAATGGISMTAATGSTTVGDLTVASDLQVTVTGGLTVTDTFTASSEQAVWVLNGALTLDGATVDLTGLTLAQDKQSYTLGWASSYSLAGVTIDLTEAQLTAAGFAADTQYTVGADADGWLVLSLTPNTPEVKPTLTEITITGGAYDATAGVLTLTTSDTIVDAVFGDTLNAIMPDDKWEAIVGATTLPDSVLVSITDGQGNYIDFDMDDDGTIDTALTINGEGITGTPVVGGTPNSGTIVGGYVTSYIPEPTTTTLSLLALAGLAVRRRRASR